MHFTARETADLVCSTLERLYPGVLFAVRLMDPVPVAVGGTAEKRSLEVIWVGGPTREEVAEAVEPFQGIEWDPISGRLLPLEHFTVNEAGQLQKVTYGVDYIFCEGPLD